MWARSEIFNLSSHPCNPASKKTKHPLNVLIASNTFICFYLADITTSNKLLLYAESF